MIRIKNVEIQLSDKSVININEQDEGGSLKQICDLIIKEIFTRKLQTTSGISDHAQWDTAHEIGMKSSSTIYRALLRCGDADHKEESFEARAE